MILRLNDFVFLENKNNPSHQKKLHNNRNIQIRYSSLLEHRVLRHTGMFYVKANFLTAITIHHLSQKPLYILPLC